LRIWDCEGEERGQAAAIFVCSYVYVMRLLELQGIFLEFWEKFFGGRAARGAKEEAF
jgi:hypothetical protein